ncbi:uncharacterized protein VP01_9860g1, partial [Puccinia sorghi]
SEFINAKHFNSSSKTSVQTTTNTCKQSNLEPDDSETAPCQGSILANDMGLGKTLTTLMFVLGTSHMAIDFHRSNLSNPPVQGVANLIICPLTTLSNWEKEIQTHFRPRAIPYAVFHGRGHRAIKREDLSSSLVVLTTYKIIGPIQMQMMLAPQY